LLQRNLEGRLSLFITNISSTRQMQKPEKDFSKADLAGNN